MSRLIDADELKAAFPYSGLVRTEFFCATIDHMPTIEPKKGSWCFTPDGKLVCSCCYENPTNRIILDGNLIYDMTPIRGRMKFCPNCGADMRGEQDEQIR